MVYYSHEDGTALKQQYRPLLQVSHHLEKLRSFLGYTAPLTRDTRKGQVRIVLPSDAICNALIQKGCHPNKSLTLTFPDNGYFHSCHFIRGFFDGDGGIYYNDQTHTREFAVDTGSKAAEGAGVGAGSGGTLGAIIAAVTATGSVAALAATGGLAAPLVAGPLAAALAGAGAGGLGGGLIGGLIGAGIPKNRAA